MEEAEALKVPEEITARAQKLKKYAELRLKFTELYYKTIDEDTDKYKAQIQEYGKQIGQLLEEINAENKSN
jgi:hypothetical protein